MKWKSRGFTSLLLAGAFLLAAISGVALYLKPKGRVADWIGWTLGGLDKSQWELLHTNACLLLILVAAVHLLLNGRTFFSYLKQRTGGLHLRAELTAAAVVLVTVTVGTVLQAPPFQWTADLGDRIKAYWEESADTLGPAPNAEKFTIARFARAIGLDERDLVTVLQQQGLAFVDDETTIEQLAVDNDLTPAQVYSAITEHHPDAIRSAREQAAP